MGDVRGEGVEEGVGDERGEEVEEGGSGRGRGKGRRRRRGTRREGGSSNGRILKAFSDSGLQYTSPFLYIANRQHWYYRLPKGLGT